MFTTRHFVYLPLSNSKQHETDSKMSATGEIVEMNDDTQNTEQLSEKSEIRDQLPEKIEVRDKLTRTPPHKIEKNVSNSKIQSSKPKTNEGKPQQRVSRSLEKLKSSSDRRNSSSQSQKRRRSKSPDENSEKMVSDTSTDDKDKDLLCPVCVKSFHKNDSCVFCECCARWFHAKCQNISEREVTAFKLLKDLAHYYCPNCKAGASELHKATVDIRYRVESLEKSVESLHKDNDTAKTDIKTLQSQQKSNTANMKTLKTVHEKLKQDVDTANTDIKTLKRSEKQIKEDVDSLQTTKTKHASEIKSVTERMNSAEDILEKIDTLIDERITAKVGNQDPSNPEETVNYIERPEVKDAFAKLIDEKVKNISIPTNSPKSIMESDEAKKLFSEKVKEKVDEHFPYLKPTDDMDVDDSSAAPNVNPSFSSAVLNVMTEQQEIMKRKLQVVVCHLRENENPEDDKKEVEELFTLMGVQVNFLEAVRVGKKKPERPRVIRVTLENPTDKRNLLAKATSLRKVPVDHKFAKVYVKPNLTQQQQTTSKNLWRQLKEIRLKNPQINYKISQGKIIEVPQSN